MLLKNKLKAALSLALACILVTGSVPVKAATDASPPNPDVYITREAFFVMLAKAALQRDGVSLPFDGTYDATVFADLADIRAENRPYIMFLYELGIVGGAIVDGVRYVIPHALLTRQDAATSVGRWLGLDPAGGVTRDPLFTDDETIAGYARGFVYQLAEMEFITGCPDGSFRPRDPVSYAETSALIINNRESGLLLTHFGGGDLGNADGRTFETLFANPHGLTFDNNGSLVVFDTYNAGVKRLGKRKSQTLLGLDVVNDDFGFAQPGHLDGPQTAALFSRPVDGVYAPNGDLFIVDRDNHAIRLLRGDRVYTFAGGVQGFADGLFGAARFNTPSAIAIDKNGNLYIADTLNHVIRRISPDGSVTTVAGRNGVPGYADGRGSAARFNEPSGIAVCGNGYLYIADTGNHVIRRITPEGYVTTVAGVVSPIPMGEEYGTGGYADGAARLALFNFPRGLYWADGVLFIADTGNHAIRALTPSGNVVTAAGSGEPGNRDGLPDRAMLNKPTAAVYRDGILYIADMLNNKIKTVPIDLEGEDFR
ncbi:MAG: S-layer homology domain-containing protein [Defluviitaleaceae bacterium]|nr:S-layer homology domain-containing protein [Defluviitaleaceae bacterium]